jgi:hypothetical protein
MTDRIDYIEFPSADRARTSGFFQSAFGWSIVSYGPVYDGIEGAGIDGGIDQSDNRVETTMAIIRTEDLDDAERRVRAAGGVITREQFDFPGGRRFHFREPGGNELAVYVARE